MFEESTYEPLAEIFLYCSENSSEDEYIYCLCSRVVLNFSDSEELNQEYFDAQIYKKEKEECSVKVFNTTTDSSQPIVLGTRKKEHDDGLSCYCSASHCSTDDSIRDAPHSDSGADLTETSPRDLGWDKFWAENGERLVWQSWINKFGGYIDSSYCYNIEDSPPTQAPPSGVAECLTEGSSEGTCHSICSELSDSLTNVTPLTVSELSTEESSLLSSSDSASSGHESQWQALWVDHFNTQYILAYQDFITANIKKDTLDGTQEIISLDEEEKEIEDNSNKICEESEEELNTRHTVADVESTSTEPTIVEEIFTKSSKYVGSESSFNNLQLLEDCIDNEEEPFLRNEKDVCSNQEIVEEPRRSKHKKVKYNHVARGVQQSVGYLLNSLRTLTVEQEDKTEAMSKEDSDSGSSSPLECTSSNKIQINNQMGHLDSSSDIKTKLPRQSLKRKFNSIFRNEKQDRNMFVKAMSLMGYATNGEVEWTKSEVVYKKKNIRWYNRALNMRSHIRFDDDGEPISHDKVFIKYLDDSDNNEKDGFSYPEIKSDFSEKDDSSGDDFFSAVEQLDSSGVDLKKGEKEKKKEKTETT